LEKGDSGGFFYGSGKHRKCVLEEGLKYRKSIQPCFSKGGILYRMDSVYTEMTILSLLKGRANYTGCSERM
jgi:hypothetical protein